MSEEACSILLPGFAQEPRKRHIRRLLLPFQIKATLLGFDLVFSLSGPMPTWARIAALFTRQPAMVVL